MLAMIKTFKTFFFGRSLIKDIWPGKQDTHYIPLVNKTFGTTGIDHIDPCLVMKQQSSRVRSRKNFKELLTWICLTARSKEIRFAELYTVIRNGDDT